MLKNYIHSDIKDSFSYNRAEEFSGGYIHKDCPHCGQYCKVPKTYFASYFACFALSYCKRCKKEVKLSVEFI